MVQLVSVELRTSPTMSRNLWECIAPTLHIAINSNVNDLVLSIMDDIDIKWQAKSRTLGFSDTFQQIKKEDGEDK